MSRLDAIRNWTPKRGEGYLLITVQERDALLAVVDAAEDILELVDFLFVGTDHADEQEIATLRAAVARVTEGERVEPREGIVTVYDHAGKYLGCMGIETWQRLVNEETSDHCQCDACRDGVLHASDCSVYNAPAFPKGVCDCSPRVTEGGQT